MLLEWFVLHNHLDGSSIAPCPDATASPPEISHTNFDGRHVEAQADIQDLHNMNSSHRHDSKKMENCRRSSDNRQPPVWAHGMVAEGPEAWHNSTCQLGTAARLSGCSGSLHLSFCLSVFVSVSVSVSVPVSVPVSVSVCLSVSVSASVSVSVSDSVSISVSLSASAWGGRRTDFSTLTQKAEINPQC